MEKGPFDVELFEKNHTVDFEDGVQYMHPKVWTDLNRLWTHGPTFRERLRWFLLDLSERWHNFNQLWRMDDEFEEDE